MPKYNKIFPKLKKLYNYQRSLNSYHTIWEFTHPIWEFTHPILRISAVPKFNIYFENKCSAEIYLNISEIEKVRHLSKEFKFSSYQLRIYSSHLRIYSFHLENKYSAEILVDLKYLINPTRINKANTIYINSLQEHSY